MQEAYGMKRILGLVLAFCLVFALAADAFAAGKPSITKQPESATTSKKGTVSFSVKTSGSIQSLTWYFVDPSTGKSYTGKQLVKAVKGISVSNPNGKKITLKKVPESMHGWTVYCHLNGNGYKVDSDRVQLLVYGLEPPEQGIVAAESGSSSDSEDEGAADSGKSSSDDEDDDGESAAAPQDKTITVSCTSKVLRKLDSSGNAADEAPVSRLEFTNTGSFIVTSEEPIISWSVNGVRFEPAEPISEFKVLNVNDNISLNLKVNRPTAASVQVDESHMCKVTCTGCTFSYLPGKLRSVTTGEVPAGAPINIVADSTELAESGYRINGAEPSNIGLSSFRFIVTEDVEISAK